MSVIFHLDLDAFFVSVERILDPSLEDKPVIVGGDPHGRGVVTACSYEAREYGLHSAMPIRNAFRLCPHGIYLHGHFEEYVRFSDLVRNILEPYAPVMQQASIDEFYMDFTGCGKIYGHPLYFASRIQEEIWNKLKLPCSIGIASNKTVAKISSDFMKPHGITYVVPGQEKYFLAPLPVEAIPGVGKVTLGIMHSKGIKKVADILRLPENYWESSMGKAGSDLYRKAKGEGKQFISPPQERKSISKERTFNDDIVDKTEIEGYLFKLTGKVCQSLRDYDWMASTISIKLRYSDFSTLTRARTIDPTDDDEAIFETARTLFHQAYTRRVGVRLIGIHLTNFEEYSYQESLFTNHREIRKRMLRAVSKIRDKFGYKSIRMGSA
ncbi:MAG: DNA polymerase IV [Ignavibacteriales bacterium]|nr:DNA polymerase IV [Ignavibacteriales bacterium]MCF8435526.1 DNA polymerase IV [Ignavibacteriales bacterium]